jgi:pilus assembly protein Flp/PilA
MHVEIVKRLIEDEDGQDLIEYALLAALVGIAAVLAWQQLVIAVGDVYGAADTAVQLQSDCTPDPGGGSVGC